VFDYTDTGEVILEEGIPLPSLDCSIMGAFIDYSEEQVYLKIEYRDGGTASKTINQYVGMMGGPSSKTYRPLYVLRDRLRRNAKEWRRKFKKVQQDSKEQNYEREECI